MVQRPNPVLLYHPDGYRVARQDLKGRHSAGESFLHAFLEQAPKKEVYALCIGQGAQGFQETIGAFGKGLVARPIRRNDVAVLRKQGLLHIPMPGIAQEASLRSFAGDDAYALSGVTHTISSREAIDGIAEAITAPVRDYDALICTSRAVHVALDGILSNMEAHLRERLGATKFTRPVMPIIPLGVHANRFSRDPARREAWRKSMAVPDDAVVILFFGRLSVHAKASPFQLAQAAELASKRTKHPLVVVWCGWFNDDFQRRVFMETAKSMAPSVPFHFVDGREPDSRFSVWSAADIFCSLSDNIQESFGLTVIEAMAAGLPVVASNWDGYREAVEDGVNGILIDTYLPKTSLADAAYRYLGGTDTYDLYIGALSQLCFVDVGQTADALVALAGDPELRARLAAAGRATIEKNFDWKAVMPRYFELWAEQTARLAQARREGVSFSIDFRKIQDPTEVFAGFPSHSLEGETRLAAGPHFSQWHDIVKQAGIVVNASVLTGRTQFSTLHTLFGGETVLTTAGCLDRFSYDERDAVLATLHWAIKVGLLRLADHNKT